MGNVFGGYQLTLQYLLRSLANQNAVHNDLIADLKILDGKFVFGGYIGHQI